MKDPIFQLDTDRCTKCVLDMLDCVKHFIEKFNPEFITPEHILYCIMYQPEFMTFCLDHHISHTDMINDTFSYLMKLDSIPEDDPLKMESMPSQQLLHLIDIMVKSMQKADPVTNVPVPYNIPAFLLCMMDLEDSMARHIIEKHLGSYMNWYEDLCKEYQKDFDDYINNAPQSTSSDAANNEMTFTTELGENGLPAMPHGHIIAAEAFVNGKRIDLSQGDLYKKLMASAGKLMGALNSLGERPHSKKSQQQQQQSEAPREPEHEPWEDMVTCLNDTYQKKNPLVGRQKELSRAIRILCRKDKNNPIFVGEPGVGKTALIYGLTRMIEEDKELTQTGQRSKLPKWLRNQHIYSLDMGSMVAGASFHGEFEQRMKTVLEGARKRGNCILYIDEIHTIMDAGGGNNSLNAAELMKPYLEDDSIRFIGTTTYKDYNKSIANNKAIARRFGQIDVKEPTTEETIEILHQLTPIYEQHHGVRYTDDAIQYAVEQSNALIHNRYLPDKAIDIIDEAGAYLQQNPLLNKKGEPKQARFQKIDKDIIRHILTDVCRIDAKALTVESNDELENLGERISQEIYGQDEAIRQVVRAVMMSKAGLMEPDKPLASLLFVGPTGVGKTEVCKVLAQQLGIELLRFDMSEYTEKHTISKLIGSPAGYVGYEEGGLLTDAIRKTPNCVLLLDEIEKAHSDIYNILLQVMDYARLTDNKGNKADFRNVIVIMTSNAGAQYAGQAAIGFGGGQSKGQAMLQAVKKSFKPEFLNRLSGTVVFNEMDKKMASLILDKKLRQLSERLEKKNVTMELSPEAHDFLLQKGYTTQYGAREMDRAVQQYLTPLLMESILFGKLRKGGKAIVKANDDALALE